MAGVAGDGEDHQLPVAIRAGVFYTLPINPDQAVPCFTVIIILLRALKPNAG
jgi:hypothetical protein